MERKIRVVIATIYKPSCPTVSSRLFPLCLPLTRKGFNFTFLVLGKRSREVSPGVTYRCYKNYWELIKIIVQCRREDTDILLACKPYSITGVLAYIVAKTKGIKYVLDVDDRVFPSEINKWWRLPLYIQEWCAERLLIHLHPPTVVASRGLAEYIGNHVNYIPNSADLNMFSRMRCFSNVIYERFQVINPVVIWPAVFFQETDRQYVLDIFRQIQQKGKNICLLVLGDGEYLSVIKTKARNMDLSNIIFAGHIDYSEIPSFYASADAGFLPLRNNHYDSCKGPIKLYEYMAMELPVIATSIGEPKYMIEKSDCGVLIPFHNADRASDIIIELLESKEAMHQKGKNGRRYLEKFQTLEKQADLLEKVLLAVINKNERKVKQCQLSLSQDQRV